MYDDYKVFLWNVSRLRAGSTNIVSIPDGSQKCFYPPNRSEMLQGLSVPVLNRYRVLFTEG